jgi:hypothetical protein
VTVPAIDPQLAGVMPVTELNRLFVCDAGAGDVGGAVQEIETVTAGRDREEGTEDAHTRNRVRAAVKNLGHPAADNSGETGDRKINAAELG